MKHKILYGLLITILVGVMAFAGWQIWKTQSEYAAGEDAYADIGQLVNIPTVSPEQELPTDEPQSDDEPDVPTEPEDDTVWPEVDFAALAEINPDIVAWIYLEGTEINYPVVQGDDNNYYLKHLFTGEWNGAGCIFMDSRNNGDFSERNTVIYGHHMRNKSMFSGLDGYKQQEFYDTHPVVLILTPEQNYKLEVFSAYVANVEDSAWDLGFTASGCENWLEEICAKSGVVSAVTPTVGDRVVTLSTCSYEFNDARFVVHGILK